MAFFNLAHLGPQDSIQAKLKEASPVKPSEGEKDKRKADVLHRQQQGLGASSDEPPSTSTAVPTHCIESSAPVGAVSDKQSCSKNIPWHNGSHVKYTDMLRKHQRNPEGPNDLYTGPVTTQQEYGWWSRQDDCKPQPWTRTEKHPLVNSEMTRFVDEMSLTNKEFSLY